MAKPLPSKAIDLAGRCHRFYPTILGTIYAGFILQTGRYSCIDCGLEFLVKGNKAQKDCVISCG